VTIASLACAATPDKESPSRGKAKSCTEVEVTIEKVADGCAKKGVQVKAVATKPGGTFEWKSPDGLSFSDKQTVREDDKATSTVTVTARDGGYYKVGVRYSLQGDEDTDTSNEFLLAYVKTLQPSQNCRVIFDDATVGVVTVDCEAADSGGNKDRLTWVCDLPHEDWDPGIRGFEGGKTEQSTMTWEMASINAFFGEREIKLIYYYGSGGRGLYSICSDSTKVRLYYAPNRTNHPGPGRGTVGNFFYYYEQTGARSKGVRAEFDPDTGLPGYSKCGRSRLTGKINKAPGKGWLKDRIYIGSRAISQVYIGPYKHRGALLEHIDSYKAICAHEKKHRDDSRAGYGHNDEDGDLLADKLEDKNGNGKYEWWLGETDPEDTDSFHRQIIMAGRSIAGPYPKSFF
jgi:hypothetical protein